MMIWLVILSDRRCDDQYLAATDILGACVHADKMMGGYSSRHEWKREDPHENFTDAALSAADADAWFYHHTTDFDEGPSIHIERVVLDTTQKVRK